MEHVIISSYGFFQIQEPGEIDKRVGEYPCVFIFFNKSPELFHETAFFREMVNLVPYIFLYFITFSDYITIRQ